MRAFLIGVGAIVVAVTLPNGAALADTDMPYVSLRGSVAWADEANTKVSGVPYHASFNTGVGGSVAFGSRSPWLGLRLEIEGIYRYFAPKKLSSGGVSIPASGQVNLYAPMVNAIYDIPVNDRWLIQPYIGGGIGAMDASVRPGGGSVSVVNGNDWGFAYQAMAGLEAPVTENLTFTVGYRFLAAPKLRFFAIGSVPFKTNAATQGIDIGFDYHI